MYTYFGSETNTNQRAKTRELAQFIISNFNNGVKNAKLCEIDEKFKSNRFLSEFEGFLLDLDEKSSCDETEKSCILYKFEESQLVELDTI